MSEEKQHLIVGLGNPGPAYATTRHNIGFMVIDRLLQGHLLRPCRLPINAYLAQGTVAGIPVLAVKPLAYMNLSGGPVAATLNTFGLHCEDMVVIHDDIDLAYGRLKIKQKGGDGGHNGLRSLTDALGTDAFTRVRMGVGRPSPGIGVVDYVLGDFDAEARQTLGRFLSQAAAAVEAILCEGAKEAMNRFNRKP